MIYGYARISTKQQKIERQIQNIKESYPDAVMITEEYTGTKIDRPNWNKLMKRIKSGDTVVFDEVSRMSRNAVEGFDTYKELFEKNVNLVFLKEPHINTSVYRDSINNSIELTGNEIADVYIEATNRVMMILAEKQIHLAFETAEKEVQYLRRRTSEGIAEVKRQNERIRMGLENGEPKQIGQEKGRKLITKKSIEAKAVIREHSKDFGGTLDDTECMKLTGLSRNTYYKYKREIRWEGINKSLEELNKK